MSAVSLQDFLNAVLLPAGDEAMAWVTTFEEPPTPDARWGGHLCAPEDVPVVNGENAYYSLGAFPTTATARVIAQSLGVCVLVLDDVGTKVSTERALSIMGEPSYRLETSRGNFQWGYFLAAMATEEQFREIHDGLMALKLSDKSGNNAVRYGRLPAGINNKPEYGEPCVVVAKSLNLALRFHVTDIIRRLRAAMPEITNNGTDHAKFDATTDEELKEAFTLGEGRYEPMKKLSARWAARGMEADDITAALLEQLARHPDGVKKHSKSARTLAKTAVKKFGETRRKKATGDVALDEMNKRHALVWVSNKLMVMWKDQWDGGLPRMTQLSDTRTWYRNKQTGKVNPVDAWVDSPGRAEHSKIVFEPGGLRTPEAFNLFTGWEMEARKGDCSLMLELLRDVWCARDEGAFTWVQDWFADIFQNPAIKCGTAIATVGAPGTGKNSVFQYLKRVLTRYCVLIQGSEALLGQFNDSIAAMLLAFCDEAAWPRDKRGMTKLRSYVTEPTMSIERKHTPRVEVDSHVRFIFATNEDLAAPVELDDRRYTVLRLSEHHLSNHKFWDAFHAELNGGGPAAFAWHCLHEVKLSSQLRLPYETAARSEQKLLNTDHIRDWWIEMLMSEDHEMLDKEQSTGDLAIYLRWSFGNVVTNATLHRFYLLYMDKMRIQYRASTTSLGIALKRHLLPGLPKREVSTEQSRAWDIAARAQVYQLPTLAEARSALDAKLKHPFPWPPAPEADL